MPRRKSTPRKRKSTVVFRGYKPKRYVHHRKRSIIPSLNYGKQRCVNIIPVRSIANQVGFNIVIPWQQTGIAAPPIGTSYTTFDQTPRWVATRPNWDQFAITGMRLEWMPLFNASAPALGNVMTTLFKMDDLDSYNDMGNFGTNQIMSAPGFKNLNPHRTFKKFYSFKKLSKEQNVPW